ncbi:MAG TPA: alpha/beta fold hydrolase [Armatimonadota bacterium]|nr:alpha/beta fold hydrolase [Armatimonadota bacterium]HOS43624.1 alpha/beta fold hydrolase [Armatimonadota bacterium]
MFFPHQQTALFYEDLGRGVPLLCLAPFPFDGRFFRAQHRLDDAARLVIPDYRGTGRSAVTDGPYTMDLLADDMAALLDHLGIAAAVVMGVSVGCYVAFSLVANHRRRVTALVLADTRAEADTPEQAERRRQTVAGLRAHGPAILHDRVNDLFAATTRETCPTLVEEMQRQALEQPAEGLAQLTLGMALRPDRTALLPHIGLPTLVLCGEQDAVSPPDGMRALAAAIPGAAFQLIPDAGHLAPLEQPHRANAAIREFLSTVA